jgi:hypothetical protein
VSPRPRSGAAPTPFSAVGPGRGRAGGR